MLLILIIVFYVFYELIKSAWKTGAFFVVFLYDNHCAEPYREMLPRARVNALFFDFYIKGINLYT